VTIIQVGGQTDRYAAVKAGVVDGTVVIPPLSGAAQRSGFNTIFNMTKLGIPYPQEGVVVSRQYIANRRDTLLRFLKGHTVKACATSRRQGVRHRSFGKEPPDGFQEDRQALEDSFQEVVLEQMLKIPNPNLEATKMGIELLGKDRPAKMSADPKDYVDTSLMSELEKSGFFQNLYK